MFYMHSTLNACRQHDSLDMRLPYFLHASLSSSALLLPLHPCCSQTMWVNICPTVDMAAAEPSHLFQTPSLRVRDGEIAGCLASYVAIPFLKPPLSRGWLDSPSGCHFQSCYQWYIHNKSCHVFSHTLTLSHSPSNSDSHTLFL